VSHSSSGVIKQVREGGKVLVIDHQEFPGFMEAMTMPFEVENAALAAGLEPGDIVDFTIKKVANGYPIVEIKKTGKANVGSGNVGATPPAEKPGSHSHAGSAHE
jgi:hypothetical protein